METIAMFFRKIIKSNVVNMIKTQLTNTIKN